VAQIISPSGQIQQVQLASVAQLGSLAQAQANQNMMVQAAAAAAANNNAVTSSTWSTTTVTTPSVTVQVRMIVLLSSEGSCQFTVSQCCIGNPLNTTPCAKQRTLREVL